MTLELDELHCSLELDDEDGDTFNWDNLVFKLVATPDIIPMARDFKGREDIGGVEQLEFEANFKLAPASA